MVAPSSIDAPAKINLTLEILDRTADGYHRLRSVMVPIALTDRISWSPSERFTFTTNDATLADGNLVQRAFDSLDLPDARIAVRLDKTIPVGGGLGGGSSDAAAVIRAAMEGAFGALAQRDWIATARKLGSDVPFFLVDGPALVEGTGERLTALGPAPPWWVCLVVPAATVPTGDAYKRLDAAREAESPQRGNRAQSASIRLGEALQRADFAAVQGLLHNDFEPIIAQAYPPIAAALDALRAAGAQRPLLSGSGACVFALCETESAARELERRLHGVRAVTVPLHTSGAWAGAR